MIRLGRCLGWSESSLGTQPFCWFCCEAAQVMINLTSVKYLIYISKSREITWAAAWQNQQNGKYAHEDSNYTAQFESDCPVRDLAWHSVGSQGPNASSCRLWRLIRLHGCTGWSESSLPTHAIWVVLWCCSSAVWRKTWWDFVEKTLLCVLALFHCVCDKPGSSIPTLCTGLFHCVCDKPGSSIPTLCTGFVPLCLWQTRQ